MEIAEAGHYHVLLRGIEEGTYREELKTVTVIERGCNPFVDLAGFDRFATDPGLKVVVSNTTEAGIFHRTMAEEHPESFPALLTRALKLRADAGLDPLFIVPLELLEENGRKLRDCLKKYAGDWGYGPEFFDYLDRCSFYDTLVDRIVPGFPADEAQRLFEELGEEDPFLTSGEIFHLFVLSGDHEALEAVIPFSKAGLNVVYTEDLPAYRTRKVRVLNGCHTGSVPLGLLSGVETVREFAEHPELGEKLRRLAHDEIVPAFSDTEESHGYADAVLERFLNPSIHHSFRAIALNSVTKMNTRVRPTLEDYWSKKGELPPVMTEAIAAMTELYAKGPERELPGGPIVLADYDRMDATSTASALECFFPGLAPELKEALTHAVDPLRQAWR
jgi:tagaturonate reductase